jgi:hypothetical protein
MSSTDLRAIAKARAATVKANHDRVQKYRQWVLKGENLEQRPDFPVAECSLTAAFMRQALKPEGVAWKDFHAICTWAEVDAAWLRRRLTAGVTKNGWMWDILITPTHLKLRNLRPFTDENV